MNQMDPTAALMNNQRSYESALYGLNNQTGTFNQRQALASNLFANKLQANTGVMNQYAEQNAGLANQYQDRLSQRNAQNNQTAYMADNLNAQNRGAKFNAVQGLFGDIATIGGQAAGMMNSRLSNNVAMQSIKTMAPDVFENYMKDMPEDIKKLLNAMRNK
jgi:hypothetical protein